MSVIRHLSSHQRALAVQFTRFAITGGAMTVLGVGLYAVFAIRVGWAPLVATLAAYAITGMIGYVLHSRFSFSGHGRRDNLARTGSRYAIGMLVSYAINSFFVWVFTGFLGGPAWWPVPAMVLVTPIIVFFVNRRWVFA